MKLYSKLAVINAISKILIIAAFILFVPVLIHKAAIIHTDNRLINMRDRLVTILNKVGIENFMQEEQDSSFASYNILKEEYISIEPIKPGAYSDTIENSPRNIENQIVNYRVLDHVVHYKGQNYLLEIGKSLKTIEELNITLKEFTFYTLIIVLTITILLDIGITRHLLRPFHAIENKLRSAQHPDTFNFAAIETSTNDFRYLDRTINEMMQQIKDAFLIEKEFIANVSHELLTPISILQTRLENMLTDGDLPEESTLKIIESQKTLNRLNKIIKTLLLISKIENYQYLKDNTVSAEELVNDVINEIEERLTEKRIILRTDFEQDFTIRECNRSLLYIMLFNLINNAIKYNKEKGRIEIKGYYEHEHYVLEISDTGIGIGPDDIESIFDRFKKLNPEQKGSYGLGLPIAKTVADFHDIDIKVNSELKKGTRFKLLFKLI